MGKSVRITLVVGAEPDRTFFVWALALIHRVHATAPGRVTMRIEVLKDPDKP